MAPAKKCVICSTKIELQKRLDVNILSNNLVSVLSDLCGKQLNTSTHAVDSICDECSIRLLLANKLVNKVRNVFGEKLPAKAAKPAEKLNSSVTLDVAEDYEFHCTFCNFSNKTLKTFRGHMITQHGIVAPKPYSCKQCQQTFSRYDHYQRHQVASHGAKPAEQTTIVQTVMQQTNPDVTAAFDSTVKNIEEMFKCREEGCKFKSHKPKVYSRHMLNVHHVAKNDIFRCRKCLKGYERVHHYKMHEEVCLHSATRSQLPKKKAKNKSQQTLIEETTIKNAAATSTPMAKATPELNKIKRKHIVLENGYSDNNSTRLEKSAKKKKKSENEAIVQEEMSISSVEPTKKKKKKKLQYAEIAEMKQEQQEEIKIETFICEYCNKIFYNLHKHNRHLTKKHSDE